MNAEDKKVETEKEDSGLDIDEIELALRRFSSQEHNRGLDRLLNSLFTQPIEGSDSGETEDGQD